MFCLQLGMVHGDWCSSSLARLLPCATKAQHFLRVTPYITAPHVYSFRSAAAHVTHMCRSHAAHASFAPTQPICPLFTTFGRARPKLFQLWRILARFLLRSSSSGSRSGRGSGRSRGRSRNRNVPTSYTRRSRRAPKSSKSCREVVQQLSNSCSRSRGPKSANSDRIRSGSGPICPKPAEI